MNIYVSATMPGFWTDENKPDDAQEISAERWTTLLEDGAKTGQIVDFSVYPPRLIAAPVFTVQDIR